MSILVDSSVWIDYFKTGEKSSELDMLIDENLICINDLILAELIPTLKINNQNTLIDLLSRIITIPLNISWSKLVDYQIKCIQSGINKVGIPDLIILDNVIKNDLVLFTLDKQFILIKEHIEFEQWNTRI
ncbi:MAG: PIN domain-containing protein [Thermodesulfobacteriota bacterium]